QFDRLFYYSSAFGGTWKNSYWLGVPIQKNPMDLMVYQELIFILKPDIIIETGTNVGGSALFFATILDAIDKGEIITVDIDHADNLPQHNRITYLTGNSVDDNIINFISPRVKDKVVMVILDSDHRKEHVLKELEIYSEMVSIGSYLIVEDTNITGFPVIGIFEDGPLEAVIEFIKENKDFVIDRKCELYYSTFNRCGFLFRKK
ncbi:MAG: CmcI family methyltransferase, partial [Nanoarchaeota archaeon]